MFTSNKIDFCTAAKIDALKMSKYIKILHACICRLKPVEVVSRQTQYGMSL